MSVVVIVVEAITIHLLYRTAFSEEEARLKEAAISQARLIEAVADFDTRYSNDFPDGSTEATLSQIRTAHRNYESFGNTGEFVLSRREGDNIVFLLNHRRSSAAKDDSKHDMIPWNSTWAEPMRRALAGKSGTIVDLDYRGELVLAAFEPVKILNLGIVTKIDLAELRRPFINAAMISFLISFFAIGVGSFIFMKVTEPIITGLNETVANLEKALGEVKTLSGMVPICSFCKKVRDDEGYWNQVEVYVRDRTEADFTHGICPECMVQHYSELY